MSWLLNKFAKASQAGTFVVATTIGTMLAGGFGAYDVMTEDPDSVTGQNRDRIVQNFEQKISEMSDLKMSYDSLTADYDVALLDNMEQQAATLLERAQTKNATLDNMAKSVKQDLNLVSSISEQDYQNIGEDFNDVFPFGKHKVNTSAAAHFHEAQASENLIRNDRAYTSSAVDSKMETLERGEDGPARALAVIFSGVACIFVGMFGGWSIQDSSKVRNMSYEKTPQSPLSKLSGGMKKMHQKRKKKIRRIN